MAMPTDDLLSALGWRGDRPARVVIFVAHPDDETIGVGAHLSEFTDPLVVHATDGAPRNLNDARAYGFSSAQDYADARSSELRAAMALASLGDAALVNLGFADQQAARNLVPLTRGFVGLLRHRPADFVFTHAYEGGHPDHDAVAFAAHAAARTLAAAAAPVLVEMPLYHGENGAIVRQRFGPAPAATAALCLSLPPAWRERKRAMMASFVTQATTLAGFPVEQEVFRLAPTYDFTRLPNGGEVLYESFDWGCKGADFVAFAKAALHTLGLVPCL